MKNKLFLLVVILVTVFCQGNTGINPVADDLLDRTHNGVNNYHMDQSGHSEPIQRTGTQYLPYSYENSYPDHPTIAIIPGDDYRQYQFIPKSLTFNTARMADEPDSSGTRESNYGNIKSHLASFRQSDTDQRFAGAEPHKHHHLQSHSFVHVHNWEHQSDWSHLNTGKYTPNHGKLITINKEKNTFVNNVYPQNSDQNIQIAQVSGSSTAVSQSQVAPKHFRGDQFLGMPVLEVGRQDVKLATGELGTARSAATDPHLFVHQHGHTHSEVPRWDSTEWHQRQFERPRHHPGVSNEHFPFGETHFINYLQTGHGNQNTQIAQTSGNSNSISQSQSSNQFPGDHFFPRQSEQDVGSPYLINFPYRRFGRTSYDDSSKIYKRSVLSVAKELQRDTPLIAIMPGEYINNYEIIAKTHLTNFQPLNEEQRVIRVGPKYKHYVLHGSEIHKPYINEQNVFLKADQENGIYNTDSQSKTSSQRLRVGQLVGSSAAGDYRKHNKVTTSRFPGAALYADPFIHRNNLEDAEGTHQARSKRLQNNSELKPEGNAKNVRRRSVEENLTESNNNVISLDNILEEEKKLIHEIVTASLQHEELLLVAKLEENRLKQYEIEMRNNRIISKRGIPLIRYVTDPKVKVDISKTLQNIGTITRNAFEDDKAPLYHIQNMLGSSKDVTLSAMKIPPQNLIIPSNYKVVDIRKSIVGSPDPEYKPKNNFEKPLGYINPSLASSGLLPKKIEDDLAPPEPEIQPLISDPLNFHNVYRKVGSMLRESIKSGQETVEHMGEVYHSARQALYATRGSVPRLLLPYSLSRGPILKDNVLLIAPRVLHLKENVGSTNPVDSNHEFVGMGHVMDSLGISNPDDEAVGLTRIVLHPVRLPADTSNEPHLALLGSANPFDREPDPQKFVALIDHLNGTTKYLVDDTLEALQRAKEIVGAKSLKDFFLTLKNEYLSLIKNKIDDTRERLETEQNTLVPGNNIVGVRQNPESCSSLKTNKKNKKAKSLNDDEETLRFLTDLFKDKRKIRNEPYLNNNETENVGAIFIDSPDLLKPFMGQPSKTELTKYLDKYGDAPKSKEQRQERSDHPARATNPVMYKKFFGEDLKLNGDVEDNPFTIYQNNTNNQTENVGTCMTVPKSLLKPFMGYPDKNVDNYIELDDNGYIEEQNYEEENEYAQNGENCYQGVAEISEEHEENRGKRKTARYLDVDTNAI